MNFPAFRQGTRVGIGDELVFMMGSHTLPTGDG